MIRQTKKGLPYFLVLLMFLSLTACNQLLPDDDYNDPLSHDNLYYDTNAGTLTFQAVYHAAPATDGTWHFIVHKDASNKDISMFTTGVSPHQFYQGLLKLGASAGNNVTGANYEEQGTYTQGSALEVSITWSGAVKKYALDEFLQEKIPSGSETQSKVGLEVRFAGNRATEDTASPASDSTGCLMCLYSCPAGVSSNAKANNFQLATLDGGAWRYYANTSVAPQDNTVVTITVKVVK
jgi:hypothetical protein